MGSSAGEIPVVAAASCHICGVSSTSNVGACPRVLSRLPPAHNMALCSLCLSLPFSGFPRFSPPNRDDTAGDRNFVVAYFLIHRRPGSKALAPLSKPFGVPYHENISALAGSAETCPLCALVHACVQAWLVSWDKAAETNEFIDSLCGLMGALPLEERLWLTGIPGENRGFCVWARNRSNVGSSSQGVYLLTLVGFSVEERMFTTPQRHQLHAWLITTRQPFEEPILPATDRSRLRLFTQPRPGGLICTELY